MPVVLAYLTCAIVWGTTWFAIRVSIGPGGYPTLASAAIRFAIAAVVLTLIVVAGWARPHPRTRREIVGLLFAGVLNAAGYALVYVAEEEIPGGLAAVLFSTMPLMTGIIAALTKTERLRRDTVIGALFGIAGIAVISWDRLEVSAGQALGVGLVLLSVAASSGNTVIVKRVANDLHPLASTWLYLTSTGVLMSLMAVTFERKPLPWPPPLAPSLATVYLAIVGSIVAFTSYFFLVRRVRLAVATSLVFVEPILALVIDALFETRVQLVPRTYAGMGLTLMGVLVSVAWNRSAAGPQDSAGARASVSTEHSAT